MISLWNIFALLSCILCIVEGDILRLDACNKFYAFFNVVFENALLTNTVFSLVEKISLDRCLIMCMQYSKCQSFSYMIHHSQCRIHHSTKADNETLLQNTNGWVHYETTENEQNFGPFCQKRKPCQYGRCVDTCDIKGYKCVGCKGPICETQKPCGFGRCVDTCDSKGFKCVGCSGDWYLIKSNVCFGTKDNQHGTFNVQIDAVISGIKLQHVGGNGLKCMWNGRSTLWGCDGFSHYAKKNIGVAITDDQNNIIYPSMEYHVKSGFFYIPGYNANSPYLIFNSSNYAVREGQEFRLHYGEDLTDSAEGDNSGEACADIFARICHV